MNKKRNDMEEKIYRILHNVEKGLLTYTEAKDELCVLFGVSGSFIRPMTKACKVCISYNKEKYPFNEPCNDCNAVKGKDIELWRRSLD